MTVTIIIERITPRNTKLMALIFDISKEQFSKEPNVKNTF